MPFEGTGRWTRALASRFFRKSVRPCPNGCARTLRERQPRSRETSGNVSFDLAQRHVARGVDGANREQVGAARNEGREVELNALLR